MDETPVGISHDHSLGISVSAPCAGYYINALKVSLFIKY